MTITDHTMTTFDFADHSFVISSDEEGKITLWVQCLCVDEDDTWFNAHDVYDVENQDDDALDDQPVVVDSIISLDELDTDKVSEVESINDTPLLMTCRRCPHCQFWFRYESILQTLKEEAMEDESKWETVEAFIAMAPKVWKSKPDLIIPRPLQLLPTKRQLRIGRIVSWGSIEDTE